MIVSTLTGAFMLSLWVLIAPVSAPLAWPGVAGMVAFAVAVIVVGQLDARRRS